MKIEVEQAICFHKKLKESFRGETMERVSKLPNIGKALEGQLKGIGIEKEDQLKKLETERPG